MAENINSASLALFDEVSVRFMRAVKTTYGREAAVDTLNHLQETLGKDWLGRVMFHMMADNHQYMEQFTLNMDPMGNSFANKINAIKVVRSLTGMGLGDAKQFVEVVMTGETKIGRIRTDHGLTQDKFERWVRSDVQGLREAGFTVEIM